MYAAPLQMNEYVFYVCPTCKGRLEIEPHLLCCPTCGAGYPLVDRIPDFLAPDMDRMTAPLIQRVDRADRGFLKVVSGLYESRLWYPLVIRMYLGKNTTSLADLATRIKAACPVEEGRILDVACGSATFGRRVASPVREVYGIDISMAMLQKGSEYIRREGIGNIHLARTRVESLPFPAAVFDFAICSGALHLFPDTVTALKEIARTLKTGARLVGLTFSDGQQGLVQYPWFRAQVKKRGAVRIFQITELENYFHQAGFKDFEPQMLGSGVFFNAVRV